MTDPLKSLQDRFGAELNRALLEALEGDAATVSLFGMMRYQFGYVDEQLRLVGSPGGKRFRPLLCLFVCEACSGQRRDALNTAVAIELLHNFSLVHDDIEDHDPARRHRPTLWKVWGEPHAINVGDAIFALAGRTLVRSKVDNKALVELADQFAQVALTLTEGQYLDMSFEERSDVAPQDYMDMIGRKSAALIAFSLWAGARIADAEASTRAGIRCFGEEMGKAFQIHDDIMGIWGAPEVTGKQPAKDVENRKKTWPMLEAWRLGTIEQKAALTSFYQRRGGSVSRVLAILEETGAREHAEREIQHRLAAAKLHLERTALPEETRTTLLAIASALAGQREAIKMGTVTSE